jgi:3-deoxy-manno-octulosonate cytidylyltransferase (CMP-KDO synthetase)
MSRQGKKERMSRPRNPLIAIPARLAATRLPRKPLDVRIGGEPMIVCVWRRAVAADIGPVIVAAGDAEIVSVVEAAGAVAVLTDPALPSGSDRVQAAARAYDPAGVHDAVINLQGDLPTVDPGVVARVVEPLAEPAVDMATLVAPMDPRLRDDPNSVKAVMALAPGGRIGRALYFSRARVPYGEGPLYHHMGIYAWRPAALDRFVALPQSELERRERLEQLRALEAGMRIDAAVVDRVPPEINAPEDLARLGATYVGIL